MTGKTKFEKELKQKLDDYQPANAQGDWNGIKNKIPAQTTPPWLKSVIIAGSVALVSAVLILSLPDKSEQTADNQSVNQTEENTNVHNADSKPNSGSNEETNNDLHTGDVQNPAPVNQDKTNEHQTDQHMPEQSDSENSPERSDPGQQTDTENSLITEEQPEPVTPEAKKSNDNSNPEPVENTSDQQLIASTSTQQGCLPLEVEFTTNADPELYDFKWHFGDGNTSEEIRPVHVYMDKGEYKPALYLTPKNTDNKPERISIDNITCHGIKNAEINFVKRKNLFTFNSGDSGEVFHIWNIDGEEFNTTPVDYEFKRDGKYIIKLMLKDDYGCTAEVSREVDVEIEHNYFVPNAVKPSSNGINASFGPVGEDLRDMQYRMLIFDKSGQLVFETNDIDRKWSGTNQSGEPVEGGVYLWEITTKDDYGNVRHRRGQVTLLRQ